MEGVCALLLTPDVLALGFNPRWDTEFEFEVVVPELALVRFVVEDYDASSKNDFIGQSTIPLYSLRQGECSAGWQGAAEARPGCPPGQPGVWPPRLSVCSRPPGYRHVHLLSKTGDQHPSATLFVKISLKD